MKLDETSDGSGDEIGPKRTGLTAPFAGGAALGGRRYRLALSLVQYFDQSGEAAEVLDVVRE
jgi:hypothetical protein